MIDPSFGLAGKVTRRVTASFRSLEFDGKRAFAAFVITIGICEGFAGLLTLLNVLPSRWLAEIALAMLVLAAVVTALAGFKQRTHLPVQSMEHLTKFRCAICTEACLREANEIASGSYGSDRIANELAEQWRSRSPRSFVCLLDEAGEVTASFGVMGLEKSFFDQFVAGNIFEHDLRAKDILNWSNTRKAKRIYISGVIVRDAGTPVGHERARMMLWVMFKYFSQEFDLNRLSEIYALAATPAGERMLNKHLGFQLVVPLERRKDKHNLYRLTVTPASIAHIENLLPEYNHLCTFEV